MLRKSLIYLFAAVLIFSACKKPDQLTGSVTNPPAYVSFTNVNTTVSVSKAVNVFVDANKVNNAGVISQYNTIAGTYVGVQSGLRNIVIKDTTTTSNIIYYNNNLTFNSGQSYSFYLYDIVTGGALKGILLNTDRTPDPAGKTKIRFLNFSPGSPALDFWLIRRELTVAKDSLLITGGIPYLGNVATPNIPMLSGFTVVNPNVLAGATSPTSPASDYIIRAKISGTSTIVASTAATTLVNSRNYTVFARGAYPTVTLTTMLNN